MKPDEARAAVFAALTEIAPDVDPAEVSPRASLRAAAELDSMDFLTYVALLSDVIGSDISEDDYGAVDSVDGAVAFLVARS